MQHDNKNLNSNEVDKFDRMAKDWWDPQGPMRPLHDLNPLRLQYIADHVQLSGTNVIDVGCGAGLLSEAMAKMGANVLGIDASGEAIEIATQHAKLEQVAIDYHQTTIEEIVTEKANSYNAITCLEMLEHVPHPESVIKACADLAKPGAKLFFSTLNRNIKSFLFAIVGAEYLLNLLPKGTHEYSSFIRPSELDDACRKAGLHLLDIQGITYNPLSRTCKLSSNVAVNYICCYQKPGA